MSCHSRAKTKWICVHSAVEPAKNRVLYLALSPEPSPADKNNKYLFRVVANTATWKPRTQGQREGKPGRCSVVIVNQALQGSSGPAEMRAADTGIALPV